MSAETIQAIGEYIVIPLAGIAVIGIMLYQIFKD